MQNNKVFIYVICPDKIIADNIETMYMTKEEENQYKLKLHKLEEEKHKF